MSDMNFRDAPVWVAREVLPNLGLPFRVTQSDPWVFFSTWPCPACGEPNFTIRAVEGVDDFETQCCVSELVCEKAGVVLPGRSAAVVNPLDVLRSFRVDVGGGVHRPPSEGFVQVEDVFLRDVLGDVSLSGVQRAAIVGLFVCLRQSSNLKYSVSVHGLRSRLGLSAASFRFALAWLVDRDWVSCSSGFSARKVNSYWVRPFAAGSRWVWVPRALVDDLGVGGFGSVDVFVFVLLNVAVGVLGGSSVSLAVLSSVSGLHAKSALGASVGRLVGAGWVCRSGVARGVRWHVHSVCAPGCGVF